MLTLHLIQYNIITKQGKQSFKERFRIFSRLHRKQQYIHAYNWTAHLSNNDWQDINLPHVLFSVTSHHPPHCANWELSNNDLNNTPSTILDVGGSGCPLLKEIMYETLKLPLSASGEMVLLLSAAAQMLELISNQSEPSWRTLQQPCSPGLGSYSSMHWTRHWGTRDMAVKFTVFSSAKLWMSKKHRAPTG